jgi:hypothetical protein
MLPEFPKFKKLEWKDKIEIENFTLKFPPYSDFNFISLWSWNINDQIRLSQLNKNLVIQFSDYQNGEPFYSFIGVNNVDDTASKLLQLAESEGIGKELRLLSQETIRLIDCKKFITKEDYNNFDYILSVDRLENYRGTKLASKRNYARRFFKKYGSQAEIKRLNLHDLGIQRCVIDLFHAWVLMKGYSWGEAQNEISALSRFFDISDFSTIIPIGIFVSGNLVAFWFHEVLKNEFVMSHFEKASYALYDGIYPYLVQETAHFLSSEGIKFINFEQDLGIPGLREGKSDYFPLGYLKKYILHERNDAPLFTELISCSTRKIINISIPESSFQVSGQIPYGGSEKK